jgi:high-affinity nickel-transport protein
VRPLLVGVVHGLAGSAAVALLVLATVHSVKWALVYLTVFGSAPCSVCSCSTSYGTPLAKPRFGLADRLPLPNRLRQLALGLFRLSNRRKSTAFAHAANWTPQ